MWYFTLRKLSLLVITLLILSVLSYALAYLFPGDVQANLSGIANPTPQQTALIGKQFGSGEAFFGGYWLYLQSLFAGDWGYSFISSEPLLEEISMALPASIELSTYGLLLSLLLGIPIGVWAGIRHHSKTDQIILGASLIGYSMPVFWLALILILLFSLQTGWLPMSGRISLLFDIPVHTGFLLIDIWLSDLPNKSQALADATRHMVLPTIAIAVMTLTVTIRLTRRGVIEVMERDYIKASKGRGFSAMQVFFKHAFPNALVPILPTLVLQFSMLLTSAMIVETIFSWPGIGHWLLQAIAQRDYPAIRAGMLAVSALIIIFSILLEIVLRGLDPVKGRYQYAPF